MNEEVGRNAAYHFISHTHWDREWYLTFQQFRLRLVNLIDHVLDLLDRDEQFRYFHLDGQTIVLRDYLEVRPSQRERLIARIREGRILVGPWYEQNDLFLTSAESTVRNLIEGIRLAREIHAEMKVGYLPDHFGLIGQMPQILRGVGIDNAVFGRGYDIRRHGSPLFRWCAPDGSEVTGILMTFWYNNAQRLPDQANDLKAVFDQIRAREERVTPLPHYLLMNGVDHLEAQENLSAVLDLLRHLYPDECEFVHDTLPNYIRVVKEGAADLPEESFPAVCGELREGPDRSILSGTLSSRVYLKQANTECHDLLEKWVEPLSAWCALLGLDAYDQETIRHLWRSYMENHPHDSICGCSQDAVHDHMMDRFASVKEIAGELIEQKLSVLAKQIHIDSLAPQDLKWLVVNTSQLDSRAVMKSSVYFLAEDEVRDFRLEDAQGNSVEYRVLRSEPSRVQVLSPINLPGVLSVRRFDIEWKPSVPALGYAAYRVRPHLAGNRTGERELSGLPVLENEHLRVEVQADGAFRITDKHTGATLDRLGQWEDAGDGGDLYMFKAVPGEQTRVWSQAVEFVEWRSNALYDECRYRFAWRLPAGLDSTGAQREAADAVCTMDATLRLERDSRRLNLTVEVDNQVKDHRLRLLFPAAREVTHVWAGGQFDAVKRDWHEGREFDRESNQQPFWKWVAAVDGGVGFAVYAKGLHGYETLQDGRTLAVTLLRGAENINMRAEVPLETDVQPKGQCLGKHRFELAIRPLAGESATRLYQEAEAFHQGMKTKLLAVDEERWSQGRPWVQGSKLTGTFMRPDPNERQERLPAVGTFMALDGAALLSAVKWAEDGQGMIVRLYNVEAGPGSVGMRFCRQPNRMRRVNLLEEPLADGSDVGGAGAESVFHASLAAKKIATYRFFIPDNERWLFDPETENDLAARSQ